MLNQWARSKSEINEKEEVGEIFNAKHILIEKEEVEEKEQNSPNIFNSFHLPLAVEVNFFFDRIFCSALITWLPCKHHHLYPGGVSTGYPIHRVYSGRAELSSSRKTLQTLWLPWRRTRWEKLKIDVSHFFEDQHWGRSSSSSISSSRIDFQGGWGVARLQAAFTAKKGFFLTIAAKSILIAFKAEQFLLFESTGFLVFPQLDS